MIILTDFLLVLPVNQDIRKRGNYMDKTQKKTLIVGLVFVVILNLFVIGWLISDLFGEKEDTNGTVSSTEEITTEEPTTEEITIEEPTTEEPTTEEPTTEELTTEEPTTEEPTTEAVVIEAGNIHLEETVVDNGEIVQMIEVDKTLLADLDGDGVQEKITLRLENKPSKYGKEYTLHFQIGDLYYGGEIGFGELIDANYTIDINSFSLVDLDTSDNYKEIAVFIDMMQSGIYYYLRYQDGKIIPLGVFSAWRTGTPPVSGDGTVSAKDRYDVLQTSVVTKTWKLMNPNHFHASLEEVIPEYYEFELRSAEDKLTLLKDMTFYAEMNGNQDNVITLPVGTKIDIARYYLEEGWIQILYEQDTKAVWWRLIEGALLLPMHIFGDTTVLTEYIAGLAIAG